MSAHTTAHAAKHEEHHEHGNGSYHLTLIALLILTAITVGASYVDLGSLNVTIALVIATIKATLVALIFMHLANDKPVNAIIAMAGFLFLGIFLMFCLLDYNTRDGLRPHNMPNLEKPTPTPDTLNPLLVEPPKPLKKSAPEGEEHK